MHFKTLFSPHAYAYGLALLIEKIQGTDFVKKATNEMLGTDSNIAHYYSATGNRIVKRIFTRYIQIEKDEGFLIMDVVKAQ